MPTAPAPKPSPADCIHCGSPKPAGWADTDFCCAGCQYVHRLIRDAGLGKYYALRPDRTNPLLQHFLRKSPIGWAKDLPGRERGSVTVAVEGVQCAACVWLIGELARRRGGGRASVNSALGRLSVIFVPGAFDLEAFLGELAEFGYRTAPLAAGGASPAASSPLLMRLGICAAITMNSMMLSISVYAGLTPSEGVLYPLFHGMNFLLATAAVAVGGSYFVERAFRALRSGIAHFDLPIALGLVAAYAGSSWAHFRGLGNHTYFDTLNVFITVMLLGRYIQTRLIERNRNALLRDTAFAEMRARRSGTGFEDVPFADLRAGDRLLVAPGGLVPVESVLQSPFPAEVSAAWISGESAPQLVPPDGTLPAGCRLVSRRAIEVRAMTDFRASTLFSLLPQGGREEELPPLWQNVAKVYVLSVLGAALAGFAAWSFVSLEAAFKVAVAVSVVTCPCGLGIAIPLARTLAGRRLLTLGIFARNPYLLESLDRVRKVLFDKTGTLTLTELTVANPEVFDRLAPADLAVLRQASARSLHPASQAIHHRLLGRATPGTEVGVNEIPGAGLEIEASGVRYFLGRGAPAAGSAGDAGYEAEFSREGVPLVTIRLTETLLDDAAPALAATATQGKALFLLSGDRKDRVLRTARELGFPGDRVLGGASPAEKAEAVRRLDRDDTLYIGDGINDAPALANAFLAGTPLSEHTALPERSDFFCVSGSLRWLPELFELGRRMRSVVRFNLAFALAYNAAVAGLALAGLVGPLLAAVLMPVSSVVLLTLTSARVRGAKI